MGNGISLYHNSNNNSVANNKCTNNRRAGILLENSNNNKLTGNVMLGNGIVMKGHVPTKRRPFPPVITGYSLTYYEQEIDTSNTVNGKPVYYWKDVEGGRIPDDE